MNSDSLFAATTHKLKLKVRDLIHSLSFFYLVSTTWHLLGTLLGNGDIAVTNQSLCPMKFVYE